jgi:3-oxoacyl-[acyl-carrier-protein] synthase III
VTNPPNGVVPVLKGEGRVTQRVLLPCVVLVVGDNGLRTILTVTDGSGVVAVSDAHCARLVRSEDGIILFDVDARSERDRLKRPDANPLLSPREEHTP